MSMELYRGYNNYIWQVPLLVSLGMIAYGLAFGMGFTDFILLCTFGALFWYSFETRELKNATAKTNTLREKPILVLHYTKDHFLLKNVGHGTAYNIRIATIKLDDWIFSFYFDKPGLDLVPGQERRLKIMDHSQKSAAFTIDVDIEKFRNAIFSHAIRNKKEQANVRFVILYRSEIRDRNIQKFDFAIEPKEKNPNFEQIYFVE